MKKIIYLIVFALIACDSESGWDCVQQTGNITKREFTVDGFDSILVNRDVELIIQEAADYKVVIETGENLMNDILVEVVDNQLQLTDNNTCNYVREYGITKAYVTAPNLKIIRSSSQMTVSSQGVLTYDDLQLLSENFNESDTFNLGDFNVTLNSSKLRIVSNGLSSFYISGQVDDLFVGFYSGAGRFEGQELVAQNVNIYHRGTNDMIVNPQQSLTGELRSTGNVIATNRPLTVDVKQYYTGRLIFED